MLVQLFSKGLDTEGRTRLAGELVVAVHLLGCQAVLLHKVLDELQKSALLLGRPCVLRLHLTVASTDIADADRADVVASCVSPDLGNGSAHLNGTVKVNNVVVSDAPVALGSVPPVNILCPVITALPRGRAV